MGTWLVLNVIWFQRMRGSRMWDHEETAYVLRTSTLPTLRSPSAVWDALHEGPTGPLQAMLGVPTHLVFGVDQATVIWVNLGLTALTALATAAAVRRLAGRGAGIVACAFVLVAPGILENSRGALTMVPATAFATVALLALIVGRGLRTTRWSIAAGAAIGAMALSRAMAVAFVPGLLLAGVVWALGDATPRREVLRQGVVAVATAVAVSAWWWLFALRNIVGYLTVGAPGIPTSNRIGVLRDRLLELAQYLDPVAIGKGYGPPAATGIFLAAGVLGAVGLRCLQQRRPIATEPPGPVADPLPIAPVWWAVLAGIGVSLVSSTLGWLMVPLVPWIIIAAMAQVRRSLRTPYWRIWAAGMLVPAMVAATLSSTVAARPGNRFTWCGGAAHKDVCNARSAGDASAWKDSLSRIVDRLDELRDEIGDPSPAVALGARRHLLQPSAFLLQTWIDHDRWDLDFQEYFQLQDPRAAQVRTVRESADIIVVVPDTEPAPLLPEMMDPDDMVETFTGDHLFERCARVPLPDGTVAEILVRSPTPDAVCR